MLVGGALDAAAQREDLTLDLVGDPDSMGRGVAASPGGRNRVVSAPRALGTGDPLRATLRGRIGSSMRTAVERVAAGECDALVSAGSTGALMALSRHLIGTLPGIDRPAIVKRLAGEGGRAFWMLDLGANLNAGAEQLRQFAHMGIVLAESLGGTRAPRVALLNIGSELHKGPASVRAAADLLTGDGGVNYVGYVEAHQLFEHRADVVVADGLAGNIALKSAEGAARMAASVLQEELRRAGRPLGRLLEAAAGQRLRRVLNAYNPQLYNGASLVGLARVAVKSHGGADRQGFAQAVLAAVDEVEARVPDRIRRYVEGRL